ncbi:MAG: hypothetical protein DRP63_03240, partial [Planctomycetota bacterium]
MRKFVTVVAFVAAALTAQDLAKEKLLARRAAELDAYRKLAEYIKGLRISSSTTVKDFVTESDEINAAFRTMIKHARVTDVRYFKDGTCEVDAEITLERVVTELKRTVVRHYHGSTWTDEVMENIKKHTQRKVIKVTGSGCVRDELLNNPQLMDEFISRSPSKRNDWSGLEIWERAHPRDRLLAKRAAELDAKRKLAETIKGLQISGSTYVKDFVAQSDEVRSHFDHFIKGVRITAYVFYPDGRVEAEAEVTIERVVEELKRTTKMVRLGGVWVPQTMEKVKKYTQKRIIKAIGSASLGKKYTKGRKVTGVREQPRRTPAPAMPDWANRTLKAKGQGIMPEEAESVEAAFLAAERAAFADALRKLAEQVYGLKIKAQTTVKD